MELKEIALEVAKVVAIEINRNAIDKDAPMSQDEFKLFCTELVARSVAAVDAERGNDATAWVRFTSDGGYEGPIMDSDKRISDIRRKFWSPLFLSPTTPEGMALVPIEPTEAMIASANAHDWYSDADPTWADLYRAMIQAAGVTK